MKKAALLLALCHGLAQASPIHHVIVIFQENVSFDHYFATYPRALNLPGEPPFHESRNTPSVNGLNESLMMRNPNSANPFRFPRSEFSTCDMEHDYAAEERAFDSGLMDKFVEYTASRHCDPKMVMGYYDGNTVTALWNYAQRFSMSDNYFGTTFGPSTPGAINLISGQTHGATPENLADATRDGTVYGDADPAFDDCSHGAKLSMAGKNVGDLLSSKKISWGWFQGGFRPTGRAMEKAVCGAKSRNLSGKDIPDYSPHHEPFQYYSSTSNPHHLAPVSTLEIGHDGRANHQYDLQDFWAAAASGHLPEVSFLKAKMAQDGHAGYSGPLDEQRFIVETLNRLQKLPEWKSMVVFITYDDSDGWYDHAMSPIVNHSGTALDANCGNTSGYPVRCGYGPRLPLLAVSPWAKSDYVSHSISDQSSILRFIEDNWLLGRIGDDSFDAKAGSLMDLFDFSRSRNDPLFLDPYTGLLEK